MSESKNKNRIFMIISIVILVVSAVMTVFAFRMPVLRLWETIKDFGMSVAHFAVFAFEELFVKLLGEAPVVHTNASEIPSIAPYFDYLGIDFSSFGETLLFAYERIFDSFRFVEYNIWLFNGIYDFSLYTFVGLPLIVALFILIKSCFLSPRDDSLGQRSTAYTKAVNFLLKLKPVFLLVVEYVKYFYERKYFRYLFVTVWFINFGAFTLVFDFLAFYFYFASSFNLLSFLYMLLRFGIDILIMLRACPLVLWLVFGAVTYHMYHRAKALDLLRHNEAKNCGLIKELELVILIIGEPGKGKTTFMTDVVLSLVNIYKTDSLQILYRIEMLFPGFDFASYRVALVSKIADREVFCIPDIDDVVSAMFDRFKETGDSSALYGYESKLYGDGVNLGNCVLSLQKALIIYGRAFLIYQNNNPTVANYSVRFDGEFDKSPFFKLWDGDFFKTREESYYSRILDSDIMRFGKKVDPEGKFNGSFGYGIWVRTEAAKSYGNQISNSGYDRTSDEANPLNDLVEYSLMMGRHPNATVDNKVFFRMLMDEQRASDLTAKIRELCSIISIEEKGELQLAIEGYGWLFKLRDRCKGFERFYLQYSNLRADFTLALMIPKLLVSFVNLCCERLENVYGYRELILVKEGGTSYSSNDGVKKEPKRLTWYQSNMKVLSERFATDCYASFFTEMQKKCGYGIMDYPTYDSLYPSMEQYELQKDYFLMKMMGITLGIDREECKDKYNNQFEFEF